MVGWYKLSAPLLQIEKGRARIFQKIINCGEWWLPYWWHQHSAGICLEAWKEVKSQPSGKWSLLRNRQLSKVKRQTKYLSLDPIQWKWFYPTLKPWSKLISPIEAQSVPIETKRKQVETRLVGQLGQLGQGGSGLSAQCFLCCSPSRLDRLNREWSLSSHPVDQLYPASSSVAAFQTRMGLNVSNCVQQVKQMERECLFTIQPAAVLLSKQTQNKLTWAKSGQLSNSEEVWSSFSSFQSKSVKRAWWWSNSSRK